MLSEIGTFVSVCLVPLLEVEQFLAGEESLALLRRLLVPSEVEMFVLVGRGPQPLWYFHGSQHLELVILDDFSVSVVIFIAVVHVVLLVQQDLASAEQTGSGVAVFGLQVVAVFGDLAVLVLYDLLLNVHSNFKLQQKQQSIVISIRIGRKSIRLSAFLQGRIMILQGCHTHSTLYLQGPALKLQNGSTTLQDSAAKTFTNGRILALEFEWQQRKDRGMNRRKKDKFQ